MVSATVSKLRKTSLKPGVKVNGEYYRKNLLRKLISEMRKLAGSPSKFYVFIQDGARPHTANETVEYLKEEVPELLKL